MTNENKENRRIQPNIEPFSMLTDSQWRYVTAMVENPDFNKKQAAEHVGLKPNYIYQWPDYVDEAIRLARLDIHLAAREARKQALLKAVRVKLALLDSDDEGIRSKAASEIIEWELGKATQHSDVTSGGEALKGYIGLDPSAWDDE
jgi:hypothetical protein